MAALPPLSIQTRWTARMHRSVIMVEPSIKTALANVAPDTQAPPVMVVRRHAAAISSVAPLVSLITPAVVVALPVTSLPPTLSGMEIALINGGSAENLDQV